jgi:hypothetical protein
MRLLGKDAWKSGVRTTATVERVHVTNLRESHDGSQDADHMVVILTFGFRDEHGADVTQARRCPIAASIPVPGSSVDIAYFPGKLGKLEHDRRSVRPPDREVPRGWGAGIFAVEDLGELPKALFDSLAQNLPTPRGGGLGRRLIGSLVGDLAPVPVDDDPAEIDAQRELFRTGAPTTATVTAVGNTRRRRGSNIWEQAMALQTADGSLEATAFVANTARPGDEIKIVVSPDGSRVALDSDERFTSARTAQGLVFTPPPAAPGSTESTSEQEQTIAHLARAVETGAITQKKFEELKRQILGGGR